MGVHTEQLPNSNDIRRPTETQQRFYSAGGVLGELVEQARVRVHSLEVRSAELRSVAHSVHTGPRFCDALVGTDVRVIAEIKRASPSRGMINKNLDVAARARSYEGGGAAAISVLTEPQFFGGSIEDLETASDAVSIPLLRKDFIVSEVQIFEARAAGASAVLLIARALDGELLGELVDAALECGMDPLLEVHSEAEMAAALSTRATVIGVNSRDLATLEVDVDRAYALMRTAPPDRIMVAESGISSRADVERAARSGADAVLVGAALSAAADPRAAVRALAGVERSARAS